MLVVKQNIRYKDFGIQTMKCAKYNFGMLKLVKP